VVEVGDEEEGVRDVLEEEGVRDVLEEEGVRDVLEEAASASDWKNYRSMKRHPSCAFLRLAKTCYTTGGLGVSCVVGVGEPSSGWDA
jgi:hypothetical protein